MSKSSIGNSGAPAAWSRWTRLLVATLATAAVAAGAASSASAVSGPEFGIEDAVGPALPGPSSFWAGVCDLDAAPALGVPIAGGVGMRNDPIEVPGEGIGVNLPPVSVPVPERPDHCIDHGTPRQSIPAWFNPPAWRQAPVVDAGARGDGSATFTFGRTATSGASVNGQPDNIVVDLPAGFVGNPNAVTKCSGDEFAVKPPRCPPASQVGIVTIDIRDEINFTIVHSIYPVYNLEPREGNVAELGIPDVKGFTAVRIVAKARTNSDFGVTSFVSQISAGLPLYGQTITLWAVPWAAEHDLWRPVSFRQGNASGEHIPPSGLAVERQADYRSEWGPIRPFLANETDCNPAPVTGLAVDEYVNPGAFNADGYADYGDPDWKRYFSQSPAVQGCEELSFAPDLALAPSSGQRDSATGLAVDLSIPQNNDPPAAVAANPHDSAGAPAFWGSDAGRATAHLKDSVVTLPDGVSVNPSAATGLRACSDAEIGVRDASTNPMLFNDSDPFDGSGAECPDGSILGTASVVTPLLDAPLTGQVVLGAPKSTDPQSGQMFRLFLVVRSPARGLLAKIYGSAVADPSSGRLTATFANNPEVPFSDLQLDFKGGQRGLLAMPQQCGNPGWASRLTPWSAAHGANGQSVPDGGTFAVGGDCSQRFAPSLTAGMDTKAARSGGTFSFELSRQDGEQRLRGLTATLPRGLLASVKGVALCTNAQAAAAACPAGSRIGIADAKAGSGDPFVLEHKGEVFLTEGYKGGEYGLAVKIRGVAGPFRGATELSPIVVRQAIHVDRTTAQVSAVSDPFPLIHHGVPLRVRNVTVLIDRGGFMLNPSNCAAKQVGAEIESDHAATVNRSSPFEVSGCAQLPFKPKLKLTLTGKKQTKTGKHPGVKAEVTQRGGEAGIEEAVVRLPKSLALDPDNAQALCEFADGTKPDIERHCPRGSIVGRARAISPLLNRPLAGNVYFVKNVRTDPKTGNQIRTLPMIVVALRGEIAINLKGESSTTKGGKLVNTFASVPDAPVSKFNLNIKGGRNGILAVTRTRRAQINLCAGRHVAEADMDGHNGRRHDRDVRMKVPCRFKKKSARGSPRAHAELTPGAAYGFCARIGESTCRPAAPHAAGRAADRASPQPITMDKRT